MRFLIDRENRPAEAVWLFLTREEGASLRDALTSFLDGDEEDFDWHAHVESGDGRDKELTLSFYAPDGSSAHEPRWDDWYRDDTVTDGMFGPQGDWPIRAPHEQVKASVRVHGGSGLVHRASGVREVDQGFVARGGVDQEMQTERSWMKYLFQVPDGQSRELSTALCSPCLKARGLTPAGLVSATTAAALTRAEWFKGLSLATIGFLASRRSRKRRCDVTFEPFPLGGQP